MHHGARVHSCHVPGSGFGGSTDAGECKPRVLNHQPGPADSKLSELSRDDEQAGTTRDRLAECGALPYDADAARVRSRRFSEPVTVCGCGGIVRFCARQFLQLLQSQQVGLSGS